MFFSSALLFPLARAFDVSSSPVAAAFSRRVSLPFPSGSPLDPKFSSFPRFFLDSRPRSTYIVWRQHVAGAASPRKIHPQRSPLNEEKGQERWKESAQEGQI